MKLTIAYSDNDDTFKPLAVTVESPGNETSIPELIALFRNCLGGFGYTWESINQYLAESKDSEVDSALLK
jgi:hypothetical protein